MSERNPVKRAAIYWSPGDPIPTNAMLREDGTPMLREDGSIILREDD